VTRLLDNVRLSGNSRNVTESATREELMENAIEITKLRDSIDEKTRELTFSQGLLAEKDRVLYDLRAQLEDLKAKSEQDFDFSQTHVAEHANRNATLSLRCKTSSLFPKMITLFSDEDSKGNHKATKASDDSDWRN
jgi:predicted RNase H-like nuclease (RuvC/YqgF family)